MNCRSLKGLRQKIPKALKHFCPWRTNIAAFLPETPDLPLNYSDPEKLAPTLHSINGEKKHIAFFGKVIRRTCCQKTVCFHNFR